MDRAVRIWGCAFLLAFSAARGQPAPAGEAAEPWTLEHCVRVAFESHGNVLSAASTLEASRAQLRSAASSLWYPSLSARTSRSEGRTEAKQAGTSVRRTGRTSDEQHLLSGSVVLWDGGTQRLAVRQ
ncbi:MAG: TolC family protein, partial [Armatimonadota bacterium]|nr:TolC family protein [Armatimonadota bacterium]